jgi:hypothetical protein
MATTATRVLTWPIGPYRIQIYNWSIGASDTAATWKTGLNNVDFLSYHTTTNEQNGTAARNSNDGTENTEYGTVYINSIANSETGYALVLGH